MLLLHGEASEHRLAFTGWLLRIASASEFLPLSGTTGKDEIAIRDTSLFSAGGNGSRKQRTEMYHRCTQADGVITMLFQGILNFYALSLSGALCHPSLRLTELSPFI